MGTTAGGGVFCNDTSCPCHSPTQSWEELRKDWLNFYAKLAIEPIHVGVIAKQTIADWWLTKLSQRDTALLAEIERMKVSDGSSSFRIAHNVALDSLKAFINRDKNK